MNYKVGQRVYFFGWNGEVFQDKITHVMHDQVKVVYHGKLIDVEDLFASKEELLDFVKQQLEKLR